MKKYLLIVPIVVLLLGIGIVKANSSRYISSNSCTTSGTTSTTSISYLTPGTGTTTILCNLQTLAELGGGVGATDLAVLGIQFHASSTSNSELNFYFESSNDGKDFYPEKVINSTAATTTYIVGGNKVIAWKQFATSTSYSKTGLATSSLSFGSVPIPTGTRWVKVTFVNSIGSANVGVWAQIFGKAERIDK